MENKHRMKLNAGTKYKKHMEIKDTVIMFFLRKREFIFKSEFKELLLKRKK